MRRRLAALLAATLVAGVVALSAPASPVSAATVCAGTGLATVTPGLFYPVQPPLLIVVNQQLQVAWNNPRKTSTWTITVDGACSSATPPTGSISATGTLQGYCGHSTGSGTTPGGHLVAWTSAGTFLIFTNEVLGAANAFPDPTIAGNSCAHPPRIHNVIDLLTGATGGLTFIVTVAAVLRNCETVHMLTTTLTTLPAPTGVLIPVTPHQTLLGLLFSSIHIFAPPVPHAHASVHVCVGSKLPSP